MNGFKNYNLEQLILEMPNLVQHVSGFGMNQKKNNEQMASAVLSDTKKTVYEDTPDYILCRSGNDKEGLIVLVNKKSNWVEYFVRYETGNSFLGRSVTQIEVWRDDSGEYVRDLTKRVFFNILLKKWRTIVSDSDQTIDGRRFWISRLVDANKKGLRVGLANLAKKEVNWFNASEFSTIREWLETLNAWGVGPGYERLRFVISVKQF